MRDSLDLKSFFINPRKKILPPHAFIFKLTSQTVPFLWSRRVFVQRREAASDPPSWSQCIRRVGTLLFHAVTIKHAPSACNNSAVSHSHSIPPETLNERQLQTCYKLRRCAFGSCQMTQAVLNTFRAEGSCEILLFV